MGSGLFNFSTECQPLWTIRFPKVINNAMTFLPFPRLTGNGRNEKMVVELVAADALDGSRTGGG